jgi:uncharacterized membrane protein
MNNILIALSTWLHVLATIGMVGYFVFASLVYLPIFEKRTAPDELRGVLEQVSARSRPVFGGSLLIFLVTGTYLMLVNEQYMGLGNFFANNWSILIIIKHVVVLVFLALAIIAERVYLSKIGPANPEALQRYRLSLNIDLLLGVLILLMTAVAQVV